MSKRSSAGQTRPAHHNQKIGPYRLRGLLGHGGMADVYLAQDDDHEEVALKVLKPEHVEDERYVQRFEREMEILEHLDSPFAVALIEADLEGQPPWIATDYVDGPNLREHLRKHGPLSVAEIRSLGLCLLDGLEELHDGGVFHRDLTPQNVLLSEAGPRIVDFGISHLRDASTITTHKNQFHTPGYIAPELSRGEAVTGAADIYSFGVLLLRAALSDDPDFETDERDRIDLGLDFAQAPQELRELLADCLLDDPQARPPIGVLRERLYDLGESSRPATRAAAYGWHVTPEKVTPAPLRRNPRIAWATSAAMSIAAATALLFLWPSPPPPGVVEVVSTPYEALAISDEIYAVALDEQTAEGDGCQVMTFHLVNGSRDLRIDGLLWPADDSQVRAGGLESISLESAESGRYDLRRCETGYTTPATTRIENSGDGQGEQTELLAQLSDGTVVRVCAGFSCEVPVTRHHAELHFDDLRLYWLRNPQITNEFIECFSQAFLPSDPDISFVNAESRAATMLLAHKSPHVAESLGYFDPARQEGSNYIRWFGEREDFTDWRMDSWYEQEPPGCYRLGRLGLEPSLANGYSWPGPVPDCAGESIDETACKRVLATEGAQSPIFREAFGCEEKNGLETYEMLGHTCDLGFGHHTPVLFGALAPTTGEVSRLSAECVEGDSRDSLSACDFLWLLTGNDLAGEFKGSGETCGARSSFRPVVCAEVGRAWADLIQPAGEFREVMEVWTRRFEMTSEPDFYWDRQWSESLCGLLAPLDIPEGFQFSSAGIDDYGRFKIEWIREFTTFAEDGLLRESDVLTSTLIEASLSLDEAKALLQTTFAEPEQEMRFLFETSETDDPISVMVGPSVIIAGATEQPGAEPFPCRAIIDIDLAGGTVGASDLENELWSMFRSLRILDESNLPFHSAETFETAGLACDIPNVLLLSHWQSAQATGDLQVLPKEEFWDAIEVATDLASEAARAEPTWKDLEDGLILLDIAYTMVSSGGFDLPDDFLDEIDSKIGLRCNQAGRLFPPAYSLLVILGNETVPRPDLSAELQATLG